MIKNISLAARLFSSFILVFFLILCNESKSQNATAVLDLSTVINANSKLLLGVTFDARTGMTGNTGPVGYFNTNGTLVTGLDTIFNTFPLYTLRYPGNGISTGFDWKSSIGFPAASRTPQDILGSAGPSQSVIFGFDEFMSMTINKGLSPSEVQIMVPIYATSLILDPARWNADWVEYANSLSDGSNLNGGTDWAAKRDSNGRTLPYGIRIWNIGNEPWSPNEYGLADTSCANYLADVTPIIDSMLAADPTIKITLPTVGNVNSGWNRTIKSSSLVSQGKIYGISPHFFPNETVAGSRVSNVESVLKVLSDTMSLYGLKIILGDYAHNIPNNPTIAQQNIAMQWQGANLCADFLLLMSQISNVERVNFWIYGLPPATYHPIRINSLGDYTLMPAAQIYKKFSDVILEESISVTATSPAGSDGNSYAVRTGAFATASLDYVNVVSVNRDLLDTVPLQVSGLTGYDLSESKILTASGPTAEVMDESDISADSTGLFSLPPSSILILKYSNSALPVELISFTSSVNKRDVTLNWTTSSELNNEGFFVERTNSAAVNWKQLEFVSGAGTTNKQTHYVLTDKNLNTGKNKYRLKQVDFNGNYKYYNLQNEVEVGVPSKFELGQNYPNPFNPTTKINFALPLDSRVMLKVYDMTGRELSTLVNGELKTAGYYTVDFNGSGFASGLYIYRIQTDKESVSKKMVLIK